MYILLLAALNSSLCNDWHLGDFAAHWADFGIFQSWEMCVRNSLPSSFPIQLCSCHVLFKPLIL